MAEQLIRKIVQTLRWAVIAFTGAMVIATFLQVIYRYALNAPLSWSEEASRYCFVWAVFLGAVLALERRIHIGVDILTNRLPAAIQHYLTLASEILIVLFCLVVAYASWPVLEVNMLQSSPALGITMTYIYAAIPVSMLLMALILTLRLAARISDRTDTSATGNVT